jgi:hypothetical protein
MDCKDVSGAAGHVVRALRRIGEDGDARILELGAGPALPALFVAKQRASGARTGSWHIVLQDLNEDVVRHQTWSALQRFAHAASGVSASKVRVSGVAGHWGEALRATAPLSEPFDVILASETTYRVESLAPFCSMLAHGLQRAGSVALVAMKRYYFGVGGGAREFERAFADSVRSHYTATSQQCKVLSTRDEATDFADSEAAFVTFPLAVFSDGKSNVREVIAVVRVRCP